MRVDFVFINEIRVNSSHVDITVVSANDEEDIILKQCMVGKKAYVRRTHELDGEYFPMYTSVLLNMGMKILFTPYESKFLIIINIFIFPTSP